MKIWYTATAALILTGMVAAMPRSTAPMLITPSIPGGVTSPAEFCAVSTAPLDCPHAYTEIMSSDAKYFVGFQRSGKTVWTASPVTVRRGTTVIEDGDYIYLASTGNRLSRQPVR